ncbi:hypothetical protein [Rhodococcus oxybenzonivorans]|nr:hypothetical protein [Rhodococcus oxybenzonivorans]
MASDLGISGETLRTWEKVNKATNKTLTNSPPRGTTQHIGRADQQAKSRSPSFSLTPTEIDTTENRMDTYDHALLGFALRWSGYGGGDDYIFTEFGIPPRVFYQRVLWMVEKRLASDLDLTMRQQLREHCLAKLTSFQEPR